MVKKKIKNTEIEEMVVEMIRFLKKWGLWQNTMILACGNSYTDSGNEGDEFLGLTHVVKQENVDPDEYIDLMEYPDEELSQHIFDMTFENGLSDIFRDGTLTLNSEDIENEAWDHILKDISFAKKYIEENFSDVREFLQDVLEVQKTGRKYTMWDPLEYESFEEYKQMNDDDGEGIPVYTLFDNYEEYRGFLQGNISSLEGSPELLSMVSDYLKNDLKQSGKDIEFEKAPAGLMKEFNEIFSKHGLYYEPVYNWMITGREIE